MGIHWLEGLLFVSAVGFGTLLGMALERERDRKFDQHVAGALRVAGGKGGTGGRDGA